MVLQHPYKDKAKKTKIFHDCYDYETLIGKIKKLDNSNFGRYGELVTEGIILYHRLIENYQPTIGREYGDDGWGYDSILYGKQLVQVKLKKDEDDIVAWGECTKAITVAQENGLKPEDVVFVTNCKKPNPKAKKLGCKWILYDEFKKFIDNPAFIPQLNEWIDNTKPKEITEKKELWPVQKLIVQDLLAGNGYKLIDIGVGKDLIGTRVSEALVGKQSSSLTVWGTLNRPLAHQVGESVMTDRKLNYKILIVDSAKETSIDGEVIDLVDGYEIPDSIPHTEDKEVIDEFIQQDGHKMLIVCYHSAGKINETYIKPDVTIGDEYQGLCGVKTKHKNHFIEIAHRSKHYKFISGDAPYTRFYKTNKTTKDIEYRNADDKDFGSQLGEHYDSIKSNSDGLTVPEIFVCYESPVDFEDDTELNKFWKKKKHTITIKKGEVVKVKTKAQKRTLLMAELMKDAAEYVRRKYAPRYESVISFVPRIKLSKALCDTNNVINYSTAYPNMPLYHVDGSVLGDERQELFNAFREQPNALLSNVYLIKVGTSFVNANIINLLRPVGSMGDLIQIKRHLRLTTVDRKNLAQGRISIKDRNPIDWKKPYGFTVLLVPKGFWNSRGEKSTHKNIQSMIDHQLLLGPLQKTVQRLVKQEENIPGSSGGDEVDIDITKLDGFDFGTSNIKDVKKYITRTVIDNVKKRTPSAQDLKIKNLSANILREWRNFCDSGDNRQRPFTLAQPISGKMNWEKKMCQKYKIPHHKGKLGNILDLDSRFVDQHTITLHKKWLDDRAERLHPLRGENADCVREYIKFIKDKPYMSLTSLEKALIPISSKDAKLYKGWICKTESYNGKYVTFVTHYFKTKYHLSNSMWKRLTSLGRNDKPKEYWKKNYQAKQVPDSQKKQGLEKFSEVVDTKLYNELKNTLHQNYQTRLKELKKVLTFFLKHLQTLKGNVSAQKDLYTSTEKKFPHMFKPGVGGSNNRNLFLAKIEDPMANTHYRDLVNKIKVEKQRIIDEWPETIDKVLRLWIKEYQTNYSDKDPMTLSFRDKSTPEHIAKCKQQGGQIFTKAGLEFIVMRKLKVSQQTVQMILQVNRPQGKGSNKIYKCSNTSLVKQYHNICNGYSAKKKIRLEQEQEKLLQRLKVNQKALEKIAI